MRNEKEMYALVLDVAKRDERVLAVLMNGSRANPGAPKDIFQDYDIVYVVNDIDSFINDVNWIDIFGERIILQTPEAKTNTLLPPENSGAFNYLMLFRDGNRIDLTLMPFNMMSGILGNDSDTIVLLDKKNILPEFKKANNSDYWIKPPMLNMYDECCNEFWWVLQNTAKGIWRDELPYAQRMFLCARDMLDEMINWYIGMRHDYKISAGKMGKYFNKFLDDDLWAMYRKTYADADYDHFWDSIMSAALLFRTVGKKVAEHFKYSYHDEEDEGMTNYLKKVRELPKDAKEIIL